MPYSKVALCIFPQKRAAVFDASKDEGKELRRVFLSSFFFLFFVAITTMLFMEELQSYCGRYLVENLCELGGGFQINAADDFWLILSL